MAEVKLINVNKIYDNQFHAVKDINLDIADEEFLVLVGPSGCGKSTLLRMVAGLEDISSGKIMIGDRQVNDVPPKDRDIAMVFQNYALYPHMTVFENMAFGLKLRKYSKPKIKQRVEEVADMLKLTEVLDRKPKALSGGQRQRVAVGRAIVRKPAVFLFDEPLSNLDAKLRVQMRAELIKLNQRLKTTTIYVTHDQVEAMTMGQRIAILNQGELQHVDTPFQVYNQPANRFVGGFIGSPPMNFLNAKLEKKDGLFLKIEQIELPLAHLSQDRFGDQVGKEVAIGIRPEQIRILEQELPDKSIQAEVDFVEPLGSETLVYLKTNQHRLICKVPKFYQAPLPAVVFIGFEPVAVHLFDSDSGRNLLTTG